MKRTLALIFLVFSSHAFSQNESLIEGAWEAKSRAFEGSDFVIEKDTISFPKSSCMGNKFRVIEKFQGEIISWDNKKDEYRTFILEITMNRPGFPKHFQAS